MTSMIANQNSLKWELVGPNKKINKKPADTNITKAKAKELATAKMPKLETLPPLRLQPTIYDVISESDSNDEENQKKKTKPTASPKQQKQPVNVKKTPQPAVKKVDNSLEAVLKTLTLDEFERENETINALYPNNTISALKHLIKLLNFKLNDVPEVDATFSVEDKEYPSSKLDKKIKEFYRELINKLTKQECEIVFDFILNEILNENQQSNYGFKIIIQLLIKRFPDLALKNISKYTDLTVNKYKQNKCVLVLWALGLGGFSNLSIGIKLWFEGINKYLGVKNFSSFTLNYLICLLEHYKTSVISNPTRMKTEEFVNLKQYLEFYDLVNDKSIATSKEIAAKLQNSFKYLNTLIINQQKTNYSNYFETILSNLTSEASDKQKKVLECAKLCLTHGKDTYSKWRQIYSKYLPQSQILLQTIAENWSYYKQYHINDLKQTIKYIEQNSLLYVNSYKTTQVSKPTQQGRFKNQKSTTNINELHQMENLNSLAKKVTKKHIVKYSMMNVLMKISILILLLVPAFFYWDFNTNNSIYTNQIKIQLEKYGLLDLTLTIISTVNSFYLRAKSLIFTYVPPYYQKLCKLTVQYSAVGWNVTKEYSINVWNYLQPYRVLANKYANDAINYINFYLPTLFDNLTSLYYLFLNYMSTIINFVYFYLNNLFNVIEIQLLGWKKGELAHVLSNGCDQIFQSVAKFLKWLNESAI